MAGFYRTATSSTNTHALPPAALCHTGQTPALTTRILTNRAVTGANDTVHVLTTKSPSGLGSPSSSFPTNLKSVPLSEMDTSIALGRNIHELWD